MNMLIKDLTNLERRRVSIMNRRSKGGSVSDFCCIPFFISRSSFKFSNLYFSCFLNLPLLLHTIQKVNFLFKNSILTKHQHFHEFSPNFFLTIFLVKSKLSTAKKSKPTTFSRVFHPEKLTIFSGNQSWIFGQKMKISNSVFN